jgi:hypothetical protein
VIGIKLVDFLIFCLVLDISNQVSLSVIVASITLFLVRFRVVRRALFQYDGRSRTTVP